MNYRVNTGGLTRCCTITLAEHMAAATEPPKEGETLDCRYEEPGNKEMIYTGGAWRWNKDGAT